jgi:hypothetical protein
VPFLLGYFAFLVCFVLVNRGEFVVDCVVNVVSGRPLFRGLKTGQLLNFIFDRSRSERLRGSLGGEQHLKQDE